jgi:glutamine synthetase adenylyltransferase
VTPIDPINGAPAWVRAAAVVGIPGLIAVFLVGVGATEIPRLSREIASSRQEVEVMQDLLREHIKQNDETLRLMRWICAGVAKTEPDRRQCFER